MRRFERAWSRWRSGRSTRARIRAAVGALAAILAITACSDLHFSASDLNITPTPAVPGDIVTASFHLTLIPTQQHTVIVSIDGTEYKRVTRNGAPPIPVMIELGDAAELIAEYGTGTHAAHVEVRADEANEVTRSASALLELEESTP